MKQDRREAARGRERRLSRVGSRRGPRPRHNPGTAPALVARGDRLVVRGEQDAHRRDRREHQERTRCR